MGMLLNPQWALFLSIIFLLIGTLLKISHSPDLTDSSLRTEVNLNLLSHSQVSSIDLLNETPDADRLYSTCLKGVKKTAAYTHFQFVILLFAFSVTKSHMKSSWCNIASQSNENCGGWYISQGQHLQQFEQWDQCCWALTFTVFCFTLSADITI